MSLVSIFGRRQAVLAPAPAHSGLKKRKGTPVLLITVFMLLAVLLGIVGGLGSPPLVMILGGAVMAALLFVLVDMYGMLLSLFVMTFLIQGSLLYFLGMRSATWVAVGVAILFFVRVLLEIVLDPRRVRIRPAAGGTGVIIATSMYLAIFFASMAINQIPVNQLIASVKAALPMFGVLLALYWVRWDPSRIETLWRLAVLVAVLQLPVALIQHLFVATSRTYDSIVGTFGGAIGKGGNSAIMVLFAISMFVYVLARWDRGLVSGKVATFVCTAVVGVILLGEVKASFLWLPMAAGWVLRKRAFRNVFALIGFVLVTVVFMAGTYFVYDKLYWGVNKKAESSHSVADTLDARAGYFFDPNGVDYVTGEVSRGAALAIWAKDPLATMPRRLIGYGPSASKTVGAMGVGTVAARYTPLRIDTTSMAQLLWDVGLLGSMAFIGLIITACWTALKVVRSEVATQSEKAMADTCVPILFIMAMTLIYNKTLVEEQTAQLQMMFFIGTVVQIARFGYIGKSKDEAAISPNAKLAL